MKKQCLITISLILGTLACQSVTAATLKVCPSGCNFNSIASAVTAASAGDTVAISNGTYLERDIILDKEIQLLGESKQNVVIDAQQQGRHFFIAESAQNVLIENMQLINGDANANSLPWTVDYDCAHKTPYSGYTKGGSICSKSIDLTLNHIKFANNKAHDSGGAISFQGRDSNLNPSGMLRITKSEFHKNSVAWRYGDPGITQNTYGGAIQALYSELVLVTDSVFTKNSAYHKDSNSSVAAASGGAMFIEYTKDLISSRNHYAGNNSSGKAGAVYYNSGWDWRNVQADAKFTDDTFRQNNSNTGAAIYSWSEIIAKRSTFHENKADSGGAIFSTGILSSQNNTFSGNYAANMGAAIVHDAIFTSSKLTIQNNTFVANGSDKQNQGGVVAMANGSGYTREIVNSLFLDNKTNECYLNTPQPYIRGMHNLTDTSSCEPAGFTNLAGGYVGQPFSLGNATDVDPSLTNNGGRTLTHAISKYSTAIDAATIDCVTPANNGTAVTQDQRGAPRIKYCDIGAFEYQ